MGIQVNGNTDIISAADGGLTIDGTTNFSTLQVNSQNLPNAGSLSNRNLTINGDMRIAQRGTAAVTTSGYPVDRWIQGFSTAGAVSSQQSTSVTPDDFGYSIACTVTTVDASTDAADQWNIQQHIEGYNVEQLLFGTANAKDVTVSFWVRGSVTGTYCMTLLGSSDGSTIDRSRVSEYTINTANTWEYKTITVPGDTGGTWTTDNGRGLSVRFGLTAGSDFQQSTGSWGNTNAVGSANQTQLLETLNATWYVTGVQLEVGTVATPFEHRSFGDELARCQRYYEKSYDIGDAPGTANGRGAAATRRAGGSEGATVFNDSFKVRKRDIPNIVWYNPNNGTSGQIHNISVGAITVTGTSTSAPTSETKPGAPTHAGNGSQAQIIVGHWTADAEL